MAKKSSARRKSGPNKSGAKKAGAGAGAQTSKAASGSETIEGRADEVKKKKSATPMEFAQQVRNELSKVTWTTRNETLISTVMVLVMVAIMAIFFFVVDQGLRFAVCNVLPIECVSRDSL